MNQTVVIVDDHLLIAKAIATIIDEFDGYEVLYEADNGSSLVDRFNASPKNIPEIVLLDISMPVMDGFETVKWLTKNHPVVKVIALTMQADDESLIQMIKNGASGYLNKNIHPTELRRALDTVSSRGMYYPDWATSKLLYALNHDNESEKNKLKITEREEEFLKYACSELTYKEIGEKMFCSSRTVESYRDSLFQKLGVKTRVALALYAVKAGLHTL